MINRDIEILVADSAEREHLFAEIWFEDDIFAEIFIEDSQPIVNVFNHPRDNRWMIDHETLKTIMSKFDEFLESIDYD